MKFEISKNKIKEIVGVVEKVTGKNLTLPVLGTILFIAKNNILTLRATNLDIGVEVDTPISMQQEGVSAIPGNILYGILSNIYEEKNIIFEKYSNNINIVVGDIKTTIKCFPVDDFPTLPFISNGDSFTCAAEKFITGIRSVVFSASLSDIKPELSSVYIYPEGSNLIFVSTDSFRLAEKKIPLKSDSDFNGVIIPFRNALEIARVFEGVSGDVTIRLNKNQIMVFTHTIRFISRVIDGVFPDYKQIMPKEMPTHAIALKQDVMNALKLSNIFSNKLNQIQVTIYPAKKIFQLKTMNSDIGESTILVDASLEGDDVDLLLNQRYLVDCFQSIPQDSILFTTEENKPLVIKGVGDSTFTYIVMPMNKK